MIGLAKGIAITGNVAEIVEINTETSIGSGRITITGALTDSLLVSIKNALNAAKTFIDISITDINIDIRCNIPLNGASLGLAIYSSIISALKDIPIDNNIVFTGAITKEGQILKVGAMELKRACAKKHGLTLHTEKL